MGKKDPLQALASNGGGTIRKLVGIAVTIALVVIVVRFPSDAAAWAKALVGLGSDIIDGLVSFIRQAF
ncbi:hypothetical protein [Prauserella muralis]|uniref:Uncharacterized protein n=1 Tax=Prauserella muralis TaxID=588067 RepID=A0A2V4BAF5_9PSEU|nr:hypothetical protein [Prauserella muralis]PXY32116.1 hypothetical protein BAY60_07405 [Prauserella muralis]TWE24235.1 hypothetical protein FHX69_5548 [Prauserella muralis]